MSPLQGLIFWIAYCYNHDVPPGLLKRSIGIEDKCLRHVMIVTYKIKKIKPCRGDILIKFINDKFWH